MGAIAFVVTATFLASVVEAVEALTIVLAVGLTHGWRTAWLGFAAGSLALAAVVIGFGVLGGSHALITIIPLAGLQVLIGVLLLIFGLQWMRKAILRASGLKAVHDEDAIFREEVAELTRGGFDRNVRDIDWNGFVVSTKGVFLEGLEVAFIVLTFGANRGDSFLPAIAGAVLAIVLVGMVGAVVHRPLARVPENTIKFAVSVLLVAFGTFWGGEGIGVEWTLGDLMIPVLALIYLAVAFALVGLLRRRVPAATATAPEGA
jgi:uncharacterized membrane protein